MEPRTFDFEDDSEVMKVFTEVRAVIMAESDRGAVLVGADVVSGHLQLLIERFLPDDMQDAVTRSRLFNYPGMLSSFAARTDFARASQLMGINVYKSIQLLRKLRNAVAHSVESFQLADHRQLLNEMAELSDSMAEFITLSARKMLMDDVIARFKELKCEGPSGEHVPMFKSVSEIVERLERMPGSVKVLREKAIKLELSLTVGFICGFLAAHREKPIRPNGQVSS